MTQSKAQHDWYMTNRERLCKKARSYYADHKESASRWQKDYVAKNKEQTRRYQKGYRLEHREEIRSSNREYRLRIKYGITLEQYSQMLTTQNSSCAICGTNKPGGTSTVFHVDHDHLTKIIRGFLCRTCNACLGGFQDSAEILLQATVYLRGAPLPLVVVCEPDFKRGSRSKQRRDRQAHLKRTFGITEAQYQALLSIQGGGCAICRSKKSRGTGNFPVDHDHHTGKVRGILCHPCNTALGGFKDDTEMLLRAVAYLRVG